jgi:hypothetical protein
VLFRSLDSLNIPNNKLNEITHTFELSESEKIIRIFTENTFYSFAFTNKNRVFGWGLNSSNEIINSEIKFYSKPSLISLNLNRDEKIKDIRQFIGGPAFITDNNRIIINSSSYLKTNYQHDKDIIKTAAGMDALIFLDSSGDLFVFGGNLNGLLGISNIDYIKNPTKINLNLLLTEKVKDLQMSYNGAYILTSLDRIFLWGASRSGNLVLEKINLIVEPVDVTSQLKLGPSEDIISINAMNHYFIVGTDKRNYYRFGRKIINVGESKNIFKFEKNFNRIYSDPINYDTFVLYENGFTSNKTLNFKLFEFLDKSDVILINVKHGTKMSEISNLNSSYYLLGDFSVIDDNFIPELSQFIYRVNS